MAQQYDLDPKQFAAVCELAGPDRYRHFVARVADWQFVWGLKAEKGWVAAAVTLETSAFPVWPHADYATACAIGDWSESVATPIEVHEFTETWLRGMSQEGVLVAVFPTASMSGVVVPALQLQEAIHQELSRVE
jgi:hypothetical protein